MPEIFSLIREKGSIEEHVMYNTFNMGIGMVLAVDPSDADRALEALREAGETAYVIGETARGEREADVC